MHFILRREPGFPNVHQCSRCELKSDCPRGDLFRRLLAQYPGQLTCHGCRGQQLIRMGLSPDDATAYHWTLTGYSTLEET